LSYCVTVKQEVAQFQATLGQQHRRSLKRAILALSQEKGDIRALTDQLAGFYRLKVGQFRVIFRYLPGKKIECVFAEERKLVYELFEFEMRKLLE